MPENAGRKFGKGELYQHNVLNLVKALLRLSKEDLRLEDSRLEAAVQVAWVAQDKLKVTGEYKETTKRGERVFEGTTKQDLWQLVEKTGTPLQLPQRQRDDSSTNAVTRQADVVQNALYYLEDLGVLQDERPKKKRNTRYWIFTLILKHKDASIEENLGVLKQKLGLEMLPPTDKSIMWRDVCRTMLEKQKQLTTNRLMRADEMLFDIDRIRVDLALVERKQPDKRSGDDNPEQSRLYKPDYEETQKLEYKEFLARVLKASQSNKIAIIGEPGAGKMTLLQRIAFWILDNTDGLPIWIPLGNLPTPAPKLKEYLLNNWLEDAILSVTPKIRAEFEGLLTAGRVWLLLDGVDEMVANSGNALSFIDNWIPGWCQHLSVVLTCRLNVWEANPHALNKFQTYRTLEFSQEKVNKFIEACFQNRRGAQLCAPTLGEQLQQALNQPGKERIKDLMRNPLRLMLLCSTWHLRQGKLPDTKAELYQQFVEEVYRWKKDEFRTEPEERKQLNAKLKELALAAIDKEENRFCLRHEFVEGILGDRDGSVFQLALNIGWLNRVGVDAKNPNPNQPVYAFFHPTFQEYFAALAIADWHFFLNHVPDNPAQGIYRIFEPQWKEIILLWLGREEVPKEHKEKFIKTLVEFEDGCGNFYEGRSFFLAGAGIAEFKDCSIGAAIVWLTVRIVFCNCCSDIQKEKIFIDTLREVAGEVLKDSAREKVVTEVTELMYSNVPDRICQETAERLVQIDPGNSNAIRMLIALTRNSPDKHIRHLSAQSLGKFCAGNFEAIKALIEMINISSDQDALAIVASGLGRIGAGNFDAINALINLMCTSSDEYIRSCTAWNLLKISPDNFEAIKVLTALISTSLNKWLRSAIAGGLMEIAPGNFKLITSLIDLLKTHPDKYTCQLIDVSLDKITFDDSEILPTLIDLIDKNLNEDIRRVAARNLSKVAPENQKAIDILRSLLNSTDTEIQRKSAYRLLKINPNDSRALNVLIELLYSPEKETSSLVARHIWEVGSGKSEVITALTDLMNISTDKETLCIATSSLGEIGVGNQKAVLALIDLMKKSSDDRTRRQAISSLGKIATGNKQAISALIDLISNNSEEEETRLQSASNLAKINSDNSTAITVLVNLLCNSQRTYKQAAQALIEILPGNWCSTIISRLKDLTSVVDKTNFEHSKACYEVLWHCAQNMTYPNFYQAWHQQEGVEKTTTSDSQSLNQADLPQNLQSAIANNPQLSQIIHLICIDRSKFIDPDRPAAEIYDQMLDQNCPECDSVPETMQALKLYWNSLKRKSDKRPVLVFYASSTNPYSEVFLTDLSKFKGAICVVTSPPAPLLQGEGSKMPSEESKSSSGSPSSLQGEAVRGWGSLQLFAPSQAIANLLEWIRAKVVEK